MDTGYTAAALLRHLEGCGAASVALVTLLTKPARREVAIEPHYCCFEVGGRAGESCLPLCRQPPGRNAGERSVVPLCGTVAPSCCGISGPPLWHQLFPLWHQLFFISSAMHVSRLPVPTSPPALRHHTLSPVPTAPPPFTPCCRWRTSLCEWRAVGRRALLPAGLPQGVLCVRHRRRWRAPTRPCCQGPVVLQ